MSKPKRKVCKCGWSGKTKSNICPLPLCRSPLSMHRERNGQQQRVNERVEPTPELLERRKAGVYDLAIDCLIAKGLVSDTQEEAYRKLCKARDILYGRTTPSIGGYGAERGGKSDGPPDKVLRRAEVVNDVGLDALDGVGLRAKAAVLGLYYSNQAQDIENLLTGLDALVSAYRDGIRKTPATVDSVLA